MTLRFFHLVPFVLLSLLLTCKTASTSQLQSFDTSLVQMLSLDRLADESQQRQICSANIIVTFYGNAEKLYEVVPHKPSDSFKKNSLLTKLNKKARARNQWYFTVINSSFDDLVAKFSSINEVCLRFKSQKGSINLAGFIDGPGMNDSAVRLYQWQAQKGWD